MDNRENAMQQPDFSIRETLSGSAKGMLSPSGLVSETRHTERLCNRLDVINCQLAEINRDIENSLNSLSFVGSPPEQVNHPPQPPLPEGSVDRAHALLSNLEEQVQKLHALRNRLAAI